MTYDPYNPKQPGDPYGQQGSYGQQGPHGQQPMYGYGYPPVPKPQTNAILSLVLSLVGFATCGVTSIVGIIFGHIAMKKIKRGEEEGHGLALAGIIIGYVATIGYALFVLFYLGILVAVISGNTY
jgi:putative exporter of polyketide antibiotics